MKVIEHLERATRPLLSFEIIPPLRGGDLRSLLTLIEDLVRCQPPFIDITSHAAQVIYDETPTGIERRVKRKRPGTLGVCALIQNKYLVDAVPHVLCQGFTREETEDFLIELRYLGIENVFAVRGDDSGFQKPLQFGRSANRYACDLVDQVAAMNRGRFLEEQLLDANPSRFCVGVAGYPEKHFEAPNLDTDVRYLRTKLEAGAEYVVTQMFYDNRRYFEFVDACRAAGITAPIIPGLKILTSKAQVTAVPRTFHVDLPPDLADEALATAPEHVAEVGIAWARTQVQELLDRGAPSIHFYVMQSANAVRSLLTQLDLVPREARI